MFSPIPANVYGFIHPLLLAHYRYPSGDQACGEAESASVLLCDDNHLR
jgi:hypothetical protein